MKAATILVALAGSALAERVPMDAPTKVKRDVATVSSVVAQVSGAITTLDGSVKAWNGGSPDQVVADSTSLVNAINSGAQAIAGTSPLTVNDALTLQAPSTALAGASQTLVDDLIAKKPQFQQAGLCSTVRDSLGQVNTGTQTLVKNVVAKLPTEVQAIAQTILSQVQKSLDEGNAAFSTSNCTDATGGGGGSSGSASGSASAPASSSASAPATGSASASATATGSATKSASASGYPTGTGSATRTSGSGSSATASTPPVVTAAAAMNVVGPVGLAMGLIAAMI